MHLRSFLLGGLVLVGAASMPARVAAQTPGCTYTFSLGLGGSISGCWAATLSQLGEDAGFVSDQYFWAGNFGAAAGPNNDPTVAGTFMFNNDCGSAGNGAFAFCNGAYAKPVTPIPSVLGELVLGLRVPDHTNGLSYNWVYSGSNSRNGNPLPTGFQQVLLQLTLGGVDQTGQFLFGWEDMNSGCIHRLTPNNNRYRMEDLGNGGLLDSALGNCDVFLPGGNGDSDFNDSWMQFDIAGIGIPTDTDTVPEPVSMTLMATGLVGLGAAARRRKK
jgi:hypothetical protein